MTQTDVKIRDFWDERSALGDTAGTNDFILSGIERRFLCETIQVGSRVLDLGCGNGTTLIELVETRQCTGAGIDFSSGMVARTRHAVHNAGIDDRIQVQQHALPPAPSGLGMFDIVYSQRCLINLTSSKDQRTAVKSVAEILNPDGQFIMIESSIEGAGKTNELRAALDLDPIDPPWHNRFFSEAEVEGWSTPSFVLEDMIHISSTYNFLSRIVYAKLAADKGEELRYDSEINQLAIELPRSIGDFGPVKAWIWRKTEK